MTNKKKNKDTQTTLTLTLALQKKKKPLAPANTQNLLTQVLTYGKLESGRERY